LCENCNCSLGALDSNLVFGLISCAILVDRVDGWLDVLYEWQRSRGQDRERMRGFGMEDGRK
jgi:hypothetical protein